MLSSEIKTLGKLSELIQSETMDIASDSNRDISVRPYES